MPEHFYIKFMADDESNDSKDLGAAEDKAPISINANWNLLKEICQMDMAVQLQCIQQVEQSMGGRVSGEIALLYYLASEVFETGSKWTPALGNSSCRFFSDIQNLAAV